MDEKEESKIWDLIKNDECVSEEKVKNYYLRADETRRSTKQARTVPACYLKLLVQLEIRKFLYAGCIILKKLKVVVKRIFRK